MMAASGEWHLSKDSATTRCRANVARRDMDPPGGPRLRPKSITSALAHAADATWSRPRAEAWTPQRSRRPTHPNSGSPASAEASVRGCTTQSDGRTDGRSVGRATGRSHGLLVGRSVGRTDGRSGGRADGRVGGRRSDGRADGRVVGRAVGWTGRRTGCCMVERAVGRSVGRSIGKVLSDSADVEPRS